MTQPLYMKIKEMIKQMAVAGTGGERLPTVAELSSRLTVNPRLVERAFRELREEGYLKTSEDGTIYPKEGRSVEDARKKELLKILVKANQYKECDVNGDSTQNSTETVSNQKV